MPISTSLQENVLSLLCFSPEHVDLIASNINVDMFDNEIYREIAEKAIRHHKRYKKAIRGHLPDVFEKQLDKSKNKKKADIYEAVIKGIHDLYKEVDPEFVMTQLKKFVHEQTTRLTLKKAVELFQEGKMDAVDRVLRERDRTRLDTFDPGLRFSRDMPMFLAFLRGLAIQYNMAVVTASQANRAGQDVTTLTRKHLAEDFSKVAISDNVVTYNQTGPESTGTDSIR